MHCVVRRYIFHRALPPVLDGTTPSSHRARCRNQPNRSDIPIHIYRWATRALCFYMYFSWRGWSYRYVLSCVSAGVVMPALSTASPLLVVSTASNPLRSCIKCFHREVPHNSSPEEVKLLLPLGQSHQLYFTEDMPPSTVSTASGSCVRRDIIKRQHTNYGEI